MSESPGEPADAVREYYNLEPRPRTYAWETAPPETWDDWCRRTKGTVVPAR